MRLNVPIFIASFVITMTISIATSLKIKVDGKGRKHLMLYGVRVIDIVNPVKWWSFAKGLFINLFLRQHVLTQYALRMYLCAECIEKGKCVDCACDAYAKMLDPTSKCSADKWGPIYNKSKWKEVQREYGIKLNFLFKKKEDGAESI